MSDVRCEPGARPRELSASGPKNGRSEWLGLWDGNLLAANGDAEATKGAADEADDALLEAGWTVGTTQANITQKTTISDAPAPKVGDTVDVTGVKLPDGALIASTITRK